MGIRERRSDEDQSMPRTFSLRRLMLVVTLVCVAVGVAVQFPDFAIATTAVMGYLAPTLFVLNITARHSRQRQAALFLGAIGAVAGYVFFTPAIMRMGPAKPWWAEYFSSYLFIAIPPAIVGLLFSAPFTIERVDP
jgi:hypothetical protein